MPQAARKNFTATLADLDVDEFTVRRAVAEIQRALKQGGHDAAALADMHTALGIGYVKLGDKEQGIHHHRNALRFEPGNPAHFSNFAVTMERLGEWEEAVDLILQAIEKGPNDAVALSNAAEILWVVGQHADAVRLMNEAIVNLRPGAVRDHVMTARVLACIGEDDAAVEMLARAAHYAHGIPLKGSAIDILRSAPAAWIRDITRISELRSALVRLELRPLISAERETQPPQNISDADNSTIGEAIFASTRPLRARANDSLFDEQG